MIKKPSTPPARTPLPRARPGPKPASPENARDFRLMMRFHPDLIEMLDIRARERGETRTRMIERILVSFLKADPRNPKMDAAGRIQADADPPASRAGDPMRFGAAWARWVTLNDMLLGFRPPDDWIDDGAGYIEWSKRATPDDPNAG
jgi:hypothetical protein